MVTNDIEMRKGLTLATMSKIAQALLPVHPRKQTVNGSSESVSYLSTTLTNAVLMPLSDQKALKEAAIGPRLPT